MSRRHLPAFASVPLLPLTAVLWLASCSAAPELAPNGEPVPLTLEEIVAGHSRQGTAVGDDLPELLRDQRDREATQVYLPVERWAPFMRGLAYLDPFDKSTVVLLEGVLEDEKGVPMAEPQLAALGITKRSPVGTYTGRFRNWGGQSHRVDETYPLVLYDTDRPHVYLAWQAGSTYAVLHALNVGALGWLRDYRPLPKALTGVIELPAASSVARLELMTKGSVTPSEVTQLLTEQQQRLHAEQVLAAQQLAAWWAEREPRWLAGSYTEKLAVWAEVVSEPKARAKRRDLAAELAAALRAEAPSQPLPLRYVLLQIADDPSEPTPAQIASAIAAATSSELEAGLRQKGTESLAPLVLPRGYGMRAADVQAARDELRTWGEQLFMASMLPLARIVHAATRHAGDQQSVVHGLGWLRGEVAWLEQANGASIGGALQRLYEECYRRDAELARVYAAHVRPQLAAALQPRVLADAEALEQQGRHATACVRFLEAWLLPGPGSLPSAVVSYTDAASSPATDPLARARRCAIKAIAAVEPPLTARMRHSMLLAERLTQPPFSSRSLGYALGMLPSSTEDLRSAAVILGVTMPYADLVDDGSSMKFVARGEAPTNDTFIGFDAWFEHQFPLPQDLRELGAQLREEDRWLKDEFASIEQQKAGIDAEKARIGAEKARMAGLGAAEHNAMLDAHNQSVANHNAAIDAWNKRNDAYKVRQQSYNAKVPDFNRRLVSERWGKLFAMRKRLDAGIEAWVAARVDEVREDDRVATGWLVKTNLPWGGPYLGQPNVQPPIDLIERELAWITENAFRQSDDAAVIEGLEDFTLTSLWLRKSTPELLQRLRPLLQRASSQRDKKVLRTAIENSWAHFLHREEVLRMFDQVAAPKVQ